TVRHGFPFTPTALAFDPVQHLLAIGNRNGSLRIIGQPGVDCHCSHESEVSIVQILFLINEGALVTVTSDDQLHLWNFRQKRPTIVHSLKFQREKVSKCHLPFQSKWLYVGTERGNVHVVNIESFTCSGYIINWNKAIELSRKTHPGPVVHLSDNPVDSNKLLIGFESGAIVFWDLRTKSAEYRYNSQEALRSISWHNEGKQFMCSHTDGSLSTWNVKSPQRPVSVTSPHAKMGQDGKPDLCKPINKVEWRACRSGDSVVIFSGGMSYDRACRTPTITVMAGKSTTVLEMEHNIVDFVSISDTPWVNDNEVSEYHTVDIEMSEYQTLGNEVTEYHTVDIEMSEYQTLDNEVSEYHTVDIEMSEYQTLVVLTTTYSDIDYCELLLFNLKLSYSGSDLSFSNIY
ncbi:Syntaxin-binding protein 5-like, partial [Bulinus truncatus]